MNLKGTFYVLVIVVNLLLFPPNVTVQLYNGIAVFS